MTKMLMKTFCIVKRSDVPRGPAGLLILVLHHNIQVNVEFVVILLPMYIFYGFHFLPTFHVYFYQLSNDLHTTPSYI